MKAILSRKSLVILTAMTMNLTGFSALAADAPQGAGFDNTRCDTCNAPQADAPLGRQTPVASGQGLGNGNKASVVNSSSAPASTPANNGGADTTPPPGP